METKSHLARDLDDLARLEQILRHAKTYDLRWAINELENWTVELEESIQEHGKQDPEETRAQVIHRQRNHERSTGEAQEREYNFRLFEFFTRKSPAV